MARKERELNHRQRSFVVEYLQNGGNATKAALSAGYSPKSAYSQGHDLLKKPEIARLLSRRSEELDIKLADLRRRLEQIASLDLRRAMKWGPDGVEVLDSDDLDDDTAMAIAGVKESQGSDGRTILELRFHDPLRALALLAKIEGMDKGDSAEAGATFDNFDIDTMMSAMTTEQLHALQKVMSNPELEPLRVFMMPLLMSEHMEMSVEEAPA
jgi:phage terminase small subunit